MSQSQVHLPRVEIKFCVKCKWNLRAAYYAQELLQTFCSPPSDITLGEIALVPTEGGIFTVTLYHATPNPTTASSPEPTPSADPERKGSLHHAGNGPTPTLAPISDPIAATPSPLSPSTTNTNIDTTTTTPQQITATQIWDREADNGFPETKELKNRIRNRVDPARRMGHIDRSLEKGRKDDVVSTAPKTEPGNKSKTENDSVASNTIATGMRDGDVQVKDLNLNSSLKSTKSETTTTTTEASMSVGDCEECRLEAREELEEEIGRINSG